MEEFKHNTPENISNSINYADFVESGYASGEKSVKVDFDDISLVKLDENGQAQAFLQVKQRTFRGGYKKPYTLGDDGYLYDAEGVKSVFWMDEEQAQRVHEVQLEWEEKAQQATLLGRIVLEEFDHDGFKRWLETGPNFNQDETWELADELTKYAQKNKIEYPIYDPHKQKPGMVYAQSGKSDYKSSSDGMIVSPIIQAARGIVSYVKHAFSQTASNNSYKYAEEHLRIHHEWKDQDII